MEKKSSRRAFVLANGTLLTGAAAWFATGGSLGATGVMGDEPPYDRELDWEGQGSENATLYCPDEEGYWHWVLTRGGPTPLQEGAKLYVYFQDETVVEATGYFRGAGPGAQHFDVYRSGGGTVVDATVKFSGGGHNTLLTISDSECSDTREMPEPEFEHWQVDFGAGPNPPMPPRYWPNDGMFGLGTTEGVGENPSHRRQETDDQLGDVTIIDNEFSFDDDDEPESVSVTFEVDSGAEPRYLHLAVFTLPGPFDMDEIEDQELFDMTSDEVGPADGEVTLTAYLPTS